VVLEGEVNPENRAATYFYEYSSEEAKIGTAGAKTVGEAALGSSSETQVVNPVEVTGLKRGRPTTTGSCRPAKRTGHGKTESFTTPALKVPVVEAGPSLTVTQTTALVSALVNPEYQETMCKAFQYGLTEAYGSEAPCEPEGVGAGASGEATSANLTGLSANTEYHYRALAENKTGKPRAG